MKGVTNFTDARSWGRRLVGGLFLACGTVCLVLTVIYLARDLSLWVMGERTTGYVVDMWAEEVDSGDTRERAFRYYLRYQFTTPDGRVFSRASSVSASEWVGLGKGTKSRVGALLEDESTSAAGVYQEQPHIPESGMGGLEEGSPVDVVYFPPYPAHNRLDESRFIAVLALAYVPMLFVSAVGLGVGWQLTRPDPPRAQVPSIREILAQDASGEASG